MKQKTFEDFGLSQEVLGALVDMGFESPTPIQKAALPSALAGRDVIGLAQTGTGKTAAFGIPLIEAAGDGSRKQPSALVLVPTRELAIQVCSEISRIGRNKGIVTAAVYGGQPITTQFRALKNGVDVVVGTPGRVMDHMRRKTLVLKNVRNVVLDEADEMLNMGFVEDMETILSEVPKERRTMLFSATMPPAIMRLTGKYMTNPETVRADANNSVVAKISQVFYEVRTEDRTRALMRLLDVEDFSRVLVFCATRKDVDDLSSALQNAGYGAAGLHGDYPQELRDETMKRFRNGDTPVLVATDVAARGLDVHDVSHVVNYSLPQNAETHVHRIGRTGRAGKSGLAITLVSPREKSRLRLIERLTRSTIRQAPLPTREDVRRARQQGTIDALAAAIETGSLDPHRNVVRALESRFSLEDIAAAAVRMMAGDMVVEDIAEIRPAARSPRAFPGGQVVKLRVGVGRKDGISVSDLVRSIATQGRIPGRDIGKIALFDRHSFVEVPAHLARQVVSSMNQSGYPGKKVKVA